MKSINRRPISRHGFALLAVLGVIAGSVALVLLIVREAQGIVLATSNRTAYTRARWYALDCVERLRAVLDEDVVTMGAGADSWLRLDVLVKQAGSFTQSGCSLSATALGDQVDVNTATPAALRRLLEALGAQPAVADSLLDALLDWRDIDNQPRPFGAELEWYSANARVTPRNGPMRSEREVALVRGFESRPSVIESIGTAPARVSLAHAPGAVLMSLPGFTKELVDEILRRRARGKLPSTLLEFASALSNNSRDSLLSRQGEVAARVTIEPDGWVLQSRGRVFGSRVTSVVEVTLVRLGDGTQVVRRREWWE